MRTLRYPLEGKPPAAQPLNAAQRRAVEHQGGPMLVLAGAGSGKTRVLTQRLIHLLRSGMVGPDEALCLTFTNKAAQEMRHRAESLLGATLPAGTLSTFHSGAARWLRVLGPRFGLQSSFSIYDSDDQEKLLADVATTLRMSAERHAVQHYRRVIEGFRHKGWTLAEVHEAATGREAERMADLFEAYEARLALVQGLDFGALITRVLDFAREDSDVLAWLRRRARYVLVDEFQDTDEAQLRLLHLLAETSGNITAVGDDDQAIYGWRGARVENIQSFLDLWPSAQVVKLEESYRCPSTVLALAHGVVHELPGRLQKEVFTQREGGPAPTLLVAHTDRAEADAIAARIQELLTQGTAAQGIGVLFRTNAQSRILEERLRAAGIPYKLVGATGFFARKEVKDVLAWARVAVNPTDDVALERAMHAPPRGLGPAFLSRLREARALVGGSGSQVLREGALALGKGKSLRRKVQAFLALLDGLADVASSGPVTTLRWILDETGYRDLLRGMDAAEGEERLRNVEELLNVAEDFEAAHEAPTLTAFLEAVGLHQGADDAVAADGHVSLMTIHMAKGLEFDALFVCGVEDELIPLRRMRDGDHQATEEERRLFYVALTRTRGPLMLSMALRRRLYGRERLTSQSPFLTARELGLLVRDPAGLPWPEVRTPEDRQAPSARPRREAWDEFDQRPLDERRGERRAVPDEGIRFEHIAASGDEASVRGFIGRQVRHNTFGEGRVIDADLMSSKTRLTIHFPTAGTKRVILDYVELL